MTLWVLPLISLGWPLLQGTIALLVQEDPQKIISVGSDCVLAAFVEKIYVLASDASRVSLWEKQKYQKDGLIIIRRLDPCEGQPGKRLRRNLAQLLF